MQAAATPGNPAATQYRLPVGRHPAKKYQKVLDARKRPIRGLWIRGDRYYARLRVPHPDTGVAQVRRVPLPEAHSSAEAQAQLRRLLTQRVDNALPSVRLAPKFRDYVEEYFAYYAQAVSAKRPKTISTERTQLNAWTEHLGELHRGLPIGRTGVHVADGGGEELDERALCLGSSSCNHGRECLLRKEVLSYWRCRQTGALLGHGNRSNATSEVRPQLFLSRPPTTRNSES